MIGLGEICHRIRHHEGLDVAHECIHSRDHAADVRIDTDDDQLVPFQRCHSRFKIAALKGAVAPFCQYDVPFGRCNPFHDILLVRVCLRQAGAPHVVQQGAVFRRLVMWLSCVEDGNSVSQGPALQGCDVCHQCLKQCRIGFIEAQKIALHVMDEKRRPLTIQLPSYPVPGGFFWSWHWVI